MLSVFSSAPDPLNGLIPKIIIMYVKLSTFSA